MIRKLRTEEIDWIEAAGNYVRLHMGSESLFHETMNNIVLVSPARTQQARAYVGEECLRVRPAQKKARPPQ